MEQFQQSPQEPHSSQEQQYLPQNLEPSQESQYQQRSDQPPYVPPQQPQQPYGGPPPMQSYGSGQHQQLYGGPPPMQPYGAGQPQQPYGGPPPMQQQPSWLEVERTRAAIGKSYTTPAVITMLLYLLFWLPGVIANLVYLTEATKTRKLTGTAPEGTGCLWAVLLAFNLPAIIGIVVFIFIFISAAAASTIH